MLILILNLFLSGKPNIDKVNIVSNEIKYDETKDIVKYSKSHQISKSFF